MKKIFLGLLLTTLLFSSCESDDDENVEPCETNQTGTLKILNSTGDGYTISVDGVERQVLLANTFINYSENEGTHTVSWVQADGYILYPTTGEVQTSVFSCSEVVATITD